MFRAKPNTSTILSVIAIVWSIWFAYQNRFLQDDAFISFRYAENLVNGLGPVFNAGDRVEGYTNFLWMLLISLGIFLGIAPEVSSVVSGIFLYAASLIVCYRLSKEIWENNNFLSLCFLFLLGSNYSFSSYATGGLETSLVTFLTIASLYFANRILRDADKGTSSFYWLGILFTLLFLTRIDSGLFIGILGGYIGYRLIRKKADVIPPLAIVSIPFVCIIGGWFLWKYFFYGTILPNTFNAKVHGGLFLKLFSGFEYLHLFLTVYWIGPFLFICLLFALKHKESANSEFLVLCNLILLSEAIYFLSIGGDFMEFRFIVPLLPILFLSILSILYDNLGKSFVLLLITVLPISSLYFRMKDRMHFITSFSFSGIESIKTLEDHLNNPIENWNLIGKRLNEYLGKTNARIAVTAAGSIPYYSKLHTVDMLGLSDRNIKDPEKFESLLEAKSGHKKYASFRYLKEQGVNIVIGHPKLSFLDHLREMLPATEKMLPSVPKNRDYLIQYFFPSITQQEQESSDKFTFVWIPIDDKVKLLVLYLTRSEELDRIIAERNWEKIEI